MEAMDDETKSGLRTPVRSDSLASQAFNIIRDAIFAGKFQPGDPLREMHLARMLRVSQATVRESLGQLEQVGLVVREPNRGTTVTSFTREEVRDRLEMRIPLEQMAAIKASRNITPEDLTTLEQLASQIGETIAAGDHYENVLVDMRFHQLIWQRSGSPILAKTLDRLTTPLFAFLMVMHKTGLSDLRQTRPHERIVDALRSRDPDRIRREIQAHIGGSYQDFLDADVASLHALLDSASDKTLGPVESAP